jgi:hypothetical protein
MIGDKITSIIPMIHFIDSPVVFRIVKSRLLDVDVASLVLHSAGIHRSDSPIQ